MPAGNKNIHSAERGKEAFVDDDFDLTGNLYTQAIELSPKSADRFAERAQANIMLGNFTETVADTIKAIALDPSMAKAYLRIGTAGIKVEEYHNAKQPLKLGHLSISGEHLRRRPQRVSGQWRGGEDDLQIFSKVGDEVGEG